MKEYAVIHRSTAAIYASPEKSYTKDGQLLSSISDEGLFGNLCRVLGEEQGFVRIMSHYGYIGYISPDDLLFMDAEEKDRWLASELMVVKALCLDVMSAPSVQGVVLASLPGGAVLGTLPEEVPSHPGWTQVLLPDGQQGWVTSVHLMPKRYGEDYLCADPAHMLQLQQNASKNQREACGGNDSFSLQQVLDRHFHSSEAEFRTSLVETAKSYLGVQYRWAGRSTFGIDCSGLVSMCYLQNGVSIYRDASIVNGHVLQRLTLNWDADGHFLLNSLEFLRPGDALYFPGHVAMYLGDGRYIHSTGKAGSNGVVINSLVPGTSDFRQDLLSSLYAVGTIRAEE